MKKLVSLSLFFPAYNDAESIPKLIDNANTIAQKVSKKYEIIVINDGSTDMTASVLKSLQKKYKKLKIVTHSQNKGYGKALISGFKSSQYEWIFYTDGDGQYDPSELLMLIDNLTDTIDVVNGYKLSRDDSFFRRTLGSCYNFFLHKIYYIPIRDVDCDFRLIKKTILDTIYLESHSGSICVELIVKLQNAGAKFAEVGVHHYPRKFGSSQFFTLKNLFQTFQENWKLYKSLH